MADNFWDNPSDTNSSSDNSVTRHAPDGHNYHTPDADTLRHMRGSRVGKFATIPAANNDGTSRGFDAGVAGVVHIDPDAPDGGVIFDPTTVHKQDIRNAMVGARYPHQVFYRLGTPARAYEGHQAAPARAPEQRSNDHLPGTYVVPSAAASGAQLYPSAEEPRVNPILLPGQHPQTVAQPLPQQPQQPQQPQAYPQAPAYAPPQPYYALPSPPQTDPNVLAMLSQLSGGLAALQQQMAAQQQMPRTTGISPHPMPQGAPGMALAAPSRPLRTLPVGARAQSVQNAYGEDYGDNTARPIHQRVMRDKATQEITDTDVQYEVPKQRTSMMEDAPQTVDEYQQSRQSPRDGVITGFETLELPFVTGPLANKAKIQVYFDIPGAGRHSARFHQVIDAKHCLTLVFDVRFEDGVQFLPPEADDVSIQVSIPKRGNKGQPAEKVYHVRSCGLCFSFGVFDMVVLIKDPAADNAVDYVEDPE